MSSPRNWVYVVVAGAGLAGFGSAQGSGELQFTNLGELRPVVFEGHVLTVGTPAAPEGGLTILYAPSEADDPAYRAAISAGAGGATVDYFDARVATPSVALMSGYDAVHTWANFAYLDPVGFGNNLAAYNDAGGNVTLGVFCTYTSGNSLGGAIMTAAYCPVDSPFGTNHFTNSTYVGNGTTCIYTGVTTLASTFRDFLVTQGSGVTDGNYADNEICHAYRGNNPAGAGQVIYSNGSGAFQLGGTGQWGLAVGQSMSCFSAAPNAWTDEGSALAGVSGDPELVGNGTMEAGSQNTVLLSNAAGNALSILFLAPSSVPTAFKGGVILPDPSVPPTYGVTTPSGRIDFRFIMPAGFPSGTEAWLQWGITDAAAVKGVALSNAVKGTAP